MDPSRDESLIFELLDFKTEVGDIGSASWFLNDLAREQDAEGFQVTHYTRTLLMFLEDKSISRTSVISLGQI